jgi:hypothetical protein
MRTTPDDFVPDPYEDTAIQSISTGWDSADQQQVATGVVGIDPDGQFLGADSDLVRGDEHLGNLAGDIVGVHGSHSSGGRNSTRVPYRRLARTPPGR